MNERDRAGTSANGFEDEDDDDENEAPCEGEPRCNPSPGLKPWAMIYNRFAV